MASVVEICNRALILLGANTITALSDDTKNAKICTIIYPQIRQDLIRMHPWNFAMKRSTLAPTGTAPDFEYEYQFNLPSDCIRVWQIYTPESPHKIESRTIVTDDNVVYLRYIADITDTTKWDSSFISMLVYKLAIDMCFAITGSPNLIPALEDQYRRFKIEAKLWDSQEDTPDKWTWGDSWIGDR
jgi:hypothetical protein